MTGNANSGRRPSPPVDLEALDELSIAQVLALLRKKGRRISRKKLKAEISVGRLTAQVNWGRLSNKKNEATGEPEPTYKVLRADLDRWRKNSLTPLKVHDLAC